MTEPATLEFAGGEWQPRYQGALINAFGLPQRMLARGEGAYVWDTDGVRYLDLLAGIAVNSLGHAHPGWASAISTQLQTLGHISNFFTSPAQVQLAERLLDLSLPGGAPAGSGVFFTNSGTEAIEAAFKLARRHGGGHRSRILALSGAFHGRTMGALALTAKPAYREPFEPLPAGVEHLPFGDVAALHEAFATDGDKVAALILEPIQGEAGVQVLPEGYLAAARELTRAHGGLLITDEVQSGIGRTGAWLAHHHHHIGSGVVPDVIVLAKGLGGGFPIGAMIGVGAAGQLLAPGQHGTTFGGNPMAAAAGLATVQAIETEDLVEHARRLGASWRSELARLSHPAISAVRGEGLLIAIEFTGDIAPAVAAGALQAGFIVNPVAPNALRLAPPLILTDEQAQSFTAALPGILDDLDDVERA